MLLLSLALSAALAAAGAAPPPPAALPHDATAPGAVAPPREAPALVVEPAAAAPAPAVAPTPISASDAGASTATPTSTPTPTPTATAIPPPPPLPQAVVEKLGLGDRAFLARDFRGALFAYQDAVYLAPRSPAARVKLGRAYLALRYPTQAIAQAEQALAVDPGHAEARRLVEEARNPPPPRPAPPAAPPRPAQGEATADARPSTSPAPRVFRFTPEAEETAAVGTAPTARALAAGTRPPATISATYERGRAADALAGAASTRADEAGALGRARSDAPAPGAPTAAQRYRAALALLSDREFERAVAELDAAIELDPRLAVAYAARASARFGLGRYRESAEDYRASLTLDGNLATPLYGLAECYRVLGDSRHAVEMYERYADSRAPDAREDLRAVAATRAKELR